MIGKRFTRIASATSAVVGGLILAVFAGTSSAASSSHKIARPGSRAAHAAACGKTVTITYLDSEGATAYAKAIPAFEKKYPCIKVTRQIVPFDSLNTTIISRLSHGGSSVDVIHADEPRISAYAKQGLLLNIDSLRAKAAANVSPVALKACLYNGKLYALPQWTSTQLLFYNKALLAKAGVTPPSSNPNAPMTWEDLVANAKKAQAAGAKWGFMFEQIDRYYQLEALPVSAGGGVGLKGPGLLQPALTTPGWI
jgi:multiple sugar transport system substrate-binding protein